MSHFAPAGAAYTTPGQHHGHRFPVSVAKLFLVRVGQGRVFLCDWALILLRTTDDGPGRRRRALAQRVEHPEFFDYRARGEALQVVALAFENGLKIGVAGVERNCRSIAPTAPSDTQGNALGLTDLSAPRSEENAASRGLATPT
jgi:hypothetical protein